MKARKIIIIVQRGWKIFSLLQFDLWQRARPRLILNIRWFRIKDFAICSMVLMKRRRLVIGHGLTSNNNITIIIISIDYIVQEEHHNPDQHPHDIIITIIKRNFRWFFFFNLSIEIICYCIKWHCIVFFFSLLLFLLGL